jgi:hypothetical protein
VSLVIYLMRRKNVGAAVRGVPPVKAALPVRLAKDLLIDDSP